jgi:hypothetical protein
MQTLLGYSAQDAGMALSPGGLAIMALMPLVGFLVSRVDARWLIAFGLASTSWALFHMSGFNLNVDFSSLAYARIYQSIGIAFLFVPINTVAYSYLPPGKNNAASGLINLARNVGGSVGISPQRAVYRFFCRPVELSLGEEKTLGVLQQLFAPRAPFCSTFNSRHSLISYCAPRGRIYKNLGRLQHGETNVAQPTANIRG